MDRDVKEFVETKKRVFHDGYTLQHLRIPSTSTLKFPGFIYGSKHLAERYKKEIYDKYYLEVFTPPRGFINYGVPIICGVAPGESRFSFGESVLLFGPSSEKLHRLLCFSNCWYFTNIVKEPFSNNNFDEKIVAKYLDSTIAELKFFDSAGSKFIFLGAYPTYDRVAKLAGLKSWIRIRHPSFFCYRGDGEMLVEQRKIREFIG
jgi:hypothetical protein